MTEYITINDIMMLVLGCGVFAIGVVVGCIFCEE